MLEDIFKPQVPHPQVEDPGTEKIQPIENNLTGFTSIDDFPIDNFLKHSKPSDRIDSLMCHALIWAKFGLKKETIKTLILLSKKGRAYILRQRLDGFLLDKHNNSASWFFNIDTSDKFRNEFQKGCLMPGQIDEFFTKVKDLSSTEKVTLMRHSYPETFVDYLRSIGQLASIYDESIPWD